MAYTKQTWECGDTITADKLNHMEDGIEECCGGGEPLIVHVLDKDAGGTPYNELDKTWREISDAYPNAFLDYTDGSYHIQQVITHIVDDPETVEARYRVSGMTEDGRIMTLVIDSENGYPRTSVE